MAILSLLPIKVGQVGVQPTVYKMTSTDSLATIITPGYLQQYACGNFYLNNDVIEVVYLYGTSSSANGNFVVSVNALTGVVSLIVELPAGLGTAATKFASDNTKPLVASVATAPNAPVLGAVATFTDNVGTIGYNPNNLTAKVVTLAISNPNYAITDANCSASSIVLATITSSANVANILKIAPNAGNFLVTFNTNPGTSTIMYMIVSPQ